MSRSTNPYTIETGEGFVGSYRVTNGRDLSAQVGRAVLREIGADHGDPVGIHAHPDGLVLASPAVDRELVTEVVVTVSGQITLTGDVLRQHLDADHGDYVRCYEHADGLLVVVDHDDPRVGGDHE